MIEEGKLIHGDPKAKGKKKKGGGFQSMGLSPPVFKAVMAKGFNIPTPIQRKAIPKIMAGDNIVAIARTGKKLH